MTAIVANISTNADDFDGTAFISVVTGATTANSSIDGVTWTARTLATSLSWNSVAAGDVGNGNVTAVAVAGGSQTVNTTSDGITWTARASALPSTATWCGVTYGNGLFVAVATGSTTAAASSTDGITWTSRTLPSSSNWLATTYGGGNFVAVTGATSTVAAYSTNGTSWSSATLPTSGDWRSVTYGGGTFVAASYNSANAAYSTDGGQTWTGTSLPVSANWSSVAYGNGVFIAVAFNSAIAAYSTDGITWSPAVLPNSRNWQCCAYSPSLKLFAAMARGSTSGGATSPNGVDWTARTIASANFNAMCGTPFKWASGDTLTINNGSTVTVNTDQKKFWKTITIADGKLRITNSSTTTPIVFAMGRNTGSTLNSIVPTNGLGTIEIEGDWIELGTSDGSPNQSFDGFYREHIPALWVETGSGTGVYTVWLNATGAHGNDMTPYPFNGLDGVGVGTRRGKFFVQDTGDSPPYVISLAGGVSSTSKHVTVTSTTGVLPGASISGTGITANSVVEEVISATELRLNLPTTASAGPNAYTVYNPYTAQLSSTIRFGDGTNGNIPASGAKIRVPNVLITDRTPALLQTSDRTLSAQVLMSGGGNLTADVCLFSESYLIATQAQTCELTNVGFGLIPLITETYNLLIDNVGCSIGVDRRYAPSGIWTTRFTRYGVGALWSYISNAQVSNLSIAVSQPQALTGTAATTGVLNLSFTQNATFENVQLFSLGTIKNLQTGLYLSDTVIGCTFTGFDTFGLAPVSMIRSNENTFDDFEFSSSMFNDTANFTTAVSRVGVDPNTGLDLVDGTKYYVKTRAFRDWTDLTQYHESRVYSFTPYAGPDQFHPQFFGAVNTASQTVVLTWTQRAPTAATVAYEIYRDTTPGFTTRDASTRLYQTGTAATVTATDAGALLLAAPSNGTTYYYVLRKYNARIANPATNTGSNGQFTVTTNQNYNNIAATAVPNCRGVSGTRVIRAIGANFNSLGIIPGMRITGTGVPGGTTVVSVDHYYQLTVSADLTSTFFDTTMQFGLVAGMYVFGTNIGQNARIQSIDSDTQLTLDVAHVGTVSGTLNFATGTESAEQEVYVHGAATQYTNSCLQSNGLSTATWTKTNVTATADVILAPNEIYFVSGSSLTITADRIAATATSGTVTQAVTTLNATQYTVSMYVMANNASPQANVTGKLQFGAATPTDFTVTNKWQRVSNTFTTVGTSTTVTITIDVNGTAFLVAGVQVETGAVATPPIPTTTVGVTSGATEISAIQVLSKTSAGATTNQGVQLSFTAAGLWTEFYLGTTSGFTPSVTNRFATVYTNSQPAVTLSTSNNNRFSNFVLLGTGWAGPLASLTTSSGNKLYGFEADLEYRSTATGALVSESALSNGNKLYDWEVKKYRNNTAAIYVFGGSAGTTNNNSGLVLENIRVNPYDIPLNNNYSGVEVKGVAGGRITPLTGTGTTATLGSTTDGVAIAYTTIYDTIFNELYQSSTEGSLYLTFNASVADVKPYTVLSGTPRFSNSGRLYFSAAGDSIEYEWPHQILGVTGFRRLGYKTNGVDIGTYVDTGFALKVEYSLDTGSGYGAYQEATPLNLYAESLPDPEEGFRLKLKLTALPNMKYTSRSSKFVQGETINGLLSGATAVVVEDENGAAGTVGTLRLSSITGNWIPGETIRSGVTTRATNLATNTFALGPSFLSYIDGLEIYTTVDQTVLYPPDQVTLTLTGLQPGTDVVILEPNTSNEYLNVDAYAGTSYGWLYTPSEISSVDICIYKAGYVPYTIRNLSLGSTDASIPVQQVADRAYA